MAEETKEAPVVRGPIQGPITDFYADKVVDKEAFWSFIKKAFPNFERHGYTLEKYVGALLNGAHRFLCPYGTDCRTDFEFMEQHAALFNKIALCVQDGSLLVPSGYKSVDFDDWLIIRDVLRFYARDEFVTIEARRRYDAEGTELYRTSLANNQGTAMLFQREPLPYRKQLWVKFKVALDPYHMVHVSPKDATFIRYTPDEKSRERDITVETTVSKYLRKFHPSLTDVQLQAIAEIHKFDCLEGGVHFFTSPDDIQNVYKNGPASCMSKGDAAYRGPQHPSVIYGDSPGVRLATLRGTSEDKFSARCFVYDNPDDPKDKRMIRVYGDTLLQRKLQKMGYVLGSWRGAKLRKVQFKDKNGKPLADTFVMPYLDDMVGGNGRDGSAQAVFSEEGQDYWVVCDYLMLNNKTKDAKQRGVKHNYLASAVTEGAFGKHIGYNYMRHNSMRVRGSSTYREPTHAAMNEWKEFRCRQCNEIFDEEFGRPYIWDSPKSGAAPKPDSWLCVRDIERQRRGNYYMTEINGVETFVNPGIMFAVSHEDQTVYSLPSISWSDPGVRQAYDLVFEHELIAKYNVVRLSWPWYTERNSFVPINKAEEISPGVWVKKTDVVITIFGQRRCKQACYFLGQNSKGELQYIDREDNAKLLTAVHKGKVMLVDGKLEYFERGGFKPANRKQYFKAVGELEEEEDSDNSVGFEQQLNFTDPLPVVDILNVTWAFYDSFDIGVNNRRNVAYIREQTGEAMRRMFPRVDADIWYLLVHTFAELKTDKHAGTEGVMGISHQITVALIHGWLLNGDTEVDKDTGETFLTEEALRKFLYNRDFVRLIGEGSSTSYVKVKSYEAARKAVGKKKLAAAKSTRSVTRFNIA